MMKKNLILKGLVVLMLLILVVGGCSSRKDASSVSDGYWGNSTVTSSESKAEMDYYDEAAQAPTMEMEFTSNEEGKAVNVTSTERKIIKNGYFTLETLEFDYISDEIKALVLRYQGYLAQSEASGYGINSRQYYTRTANYTAKIPAQSYDDFVEELKTLGNIISANDSQVDVTAQYMDIEARLVTLKVQEERLLAILKDADDLTAIIELEKALSEVRYQIESYTAQLRNLNDSVSFSTIQIRLNEVLEETVFVEPARTFGDKLSQGFKNSLTDIGNFFVDLTLFVLIASPYLIILGMITLGIIVIVSRVNKRSKKAKEIIETERLARRVKEDDKKE